MAHQFPNHQSNQGPADRGERRPLGVHVLTEFVYCERAGVVAYESESEDRGMEPTVSNLDYLPFYELEKLNGELKRLETRFYIWLGLMPAICVVTVALIYSLGWQLGLAAFPPFVLLGKVGYDDIHRMLFLLRERYEFTSVDAWLPDLNNPNPEAVNWWQLIKAGFELLPQREAYFDDELRIRGRPWKILRHGGTIIPVFFRKHPGDLHQQHFVRISAYCHLVQTCEQAEVPFGIVLNAKSHDAMAIKYNRESKEALERALREARRVIGEVSPENKPGKQHPAVCHKCPVGKLREHVPGETDLICYGEMVPVQGHIINGHRVHSHCGDRFEWIPPHRTAINAGLIVLEE